jgi:hypothetical protein
MKSLSLNRRTFLSTSVALGLSSYLPRGISGVGVTGTGRPVASYGRIDAFGSIWVNGVEFFTNTAAITVNNASVLESALRLGMTVRVSGNVDTVYPSGDALTVDYVADLLGTISSAVTLSPAGASFLVLGRTVVTDNSTVFDNVLGPATLAAGQTVEVSGLMDGNTGAIRATRVEVKSGGSSELRVSGAVSSLTASTFAMGSITVNYTAGALSAPIVNGSEVRVRGTAALAANTINATRVDPAADLSGAHDVELEGVASAVGAGQFMLGSQLVRTSAATVWVNGVPSDLVNGVVVDIDATRNADGSLQASKVKFRAPDALEITATVVSRTATSLSLLSGDGVIVTANGDTRVRDDSKRRVSNYNWNSIAVGDTLLVRGTQLNSRRDGVLARDLRRQDASARVNIRARANDIVAPLFTTIDTPVRTSAATEFQDVYGAPISAAQFFSRAGGRHIRVVGVFDGQALVASSVELEL